MPRILIGDFGAIARLGLREFLEEEGFDVVAEEQPGDRVMERLTKVRPDVVVLDLDMKASLEVAAQISTGFPAVKVIACSCEKPMMRIFPPFHRGESYLSPLSQTLLAEVIRS